MTEDEAKMLGRYLAGMSIFREKTLRQSIEDAIIGTSNYWCERNPKTGAFVIYSKWSAYKAFYNMDGNFVTHD